MNEGSSFALEFWESLNTFLSAAHESDPETVLGLALQVAQSVTEAGILAVYQAQDQIPLLCRTSGLGEAQLLPDQLPAQDLIALSKPEYWKKGKHPESFLHRAARAAGFSYLISAPLGQPNALIGLVVIADEQAPATEYTPQVTQLLATTITSIIQQHARMIGIQSDLRHGQYLLRINSTLEEHIHEGLLVLNPDLRIIRLNPSAEMILGFASHEVIDQPVERIMIGTENLSSVLTAAQQGSATFNLGNVHIYRRNGESFLAMVRIFPVMNGEQVEKIILLLQDLSEQEQIRLQTQQLEQRAILGEVTAIFAHEVRNPINNISTGLQLMAMNLPENDPNRESIVHLLQDCDRLAELIKSVLAFSRPTDYEMENLDLPLLLRRLLDRLHPRITRLNISYNLQVEADYPLICGNMRALEQVFSNLINNALQAMGESGGQLILKVQPVDTPEGSSYLEVAVADTGPGIPKEQLEHIFQPFFTTKREGTGLGLAIAKRVITAHKGIIRVDSYPGCTVFYVRLPISSPEP
jgi:PAS domain S-box-containing protein